MAPSFVRTPLRARLLGDTSLAVVALLLLPGSEVIWQGVVLIVYAVVFARLYQNRDRVRSLLRASWPVLLCVVFAACSASWSADPALTAYRVLALTGTTALGVFLAMSFSLEEQLQLIGLVLGVVAGASALVAIFLPSYGIMKAPLEGAWSGIFFHKNSLGRVMALAIVVFSLLALGTSRRRGLTLVGLLLSSALILLSRSLASLIVALACLAAIGALIAGKRRTRSRPSAIVAVAGVLTLVALLGVLHYRGTILSIVGRDPTFTGRTMLWSALYDSARLHPWTGVGYGVFWRGPELMTRELTRALRRYPIHAHNGFLDLVLELGVVGLALFLVPLVFYARRLYGWAVQNVSLLCLWPVIYLLFFALSNLAESSLVRQNTLYWALYIAAVLTAERASALPGHKSHANAPGDL